jgi:hypothetical protein
VHLSVRLGPESFLPSFLQLALFSSSRQHFGRDGISFLFFSSSSASTREKSSGVPIA